MDNNLKHTVQEMIDKGYTENEIAIAINKHQNQQELIIDKKRIKKKKIYKKDIISKILNSNIFFYALELVFPFILTTLFYAFVDNKEIYDGDLIAGLVSFVFFFVLILEWIRRKKDKTNRALYYKYIYIGLMLIVFILGVWFVNEFNERY